MGTRTVSAALVVVASGCGAGERHVRPDDLSADRHRREAIAERKEAEAHLALYDQQRKHPPPRVPGREPYVDPQLWFQPGDLHLREAERHAAHATEHEGAAIALEEYEERQCDGIAPEARGACYLLGPVEEVREVEGGVRLVFATHARAEDVAAHLRCHLAWARARAFDRELTCPLDLAGIRVHVAGDGRAVDLTSDHPATAYELRQRARVTVGRED